VNLPTKGLDPRTGKPAATSAGRFMGMNVIYGRDGDSGTPYMTRLWFGRLRLHIFHRGDQDKDPHDHPWGFWTFPLRSYVEEVTSKAWHNKPESWNAPPDYYVTDRQIVRAFRWSYRPATHTHRVLGRWGGKHLDDLAGFDPTVVAGSIWTIVWREKPSRAWGFLKLRDGRWCWEDWRSYVFRGGRDAPCSLPVPEPDFMNIQIED
jgi:hypothetical protein